MQLKLYFVKITFYFSSVSFYILPVQKSKSLLRSYCHPVVQVPQSCTFSWKAFNRRRVKTLFLLYVLWLFLHSSFDRCTLKYWYSTRRLLCGTSAPTSTSCPAFPKAPHFFSPPQLNVMTGSHLCPEIKYPRSSSGGLQAPLAERWAEDGRHYPNRGESPAH